MLSKEIIARARGEVATPIAEDRTPSVECEISETDEAYLIAIPKRIPMTHLTACKAKLDSKGNEKPITQVFAKLKFGDIVITGVGKDKDGDDCEVEFPTAAVNNVNLFMKIK